ncbi:TetR/AcrR family transcriptional regulator [Nocardia seriolae]|uniref:TetR family transcriptional regulator n=2 Tax=Nocardia seriolae TaxID=37332 RepID=A0ABC9Z6E6_9NOCA|nr:TetR/AcrR family transcriptional regulator [Nocardia seriolae]WNJ62330.1 TetR/AcrR family transcriptional regulator [Nocardia seriolae]BEK88599.1 TetR/AcrR family transcriptional regulator [Nocardia seriolae]BEK96351.1 TetR/AcrR family transcriptional regulator [Nocardia seriolae]GAM51214.1 TetR family transcriptional regulator [Nocardia seriolae]GAP33172.1 TetR family transcriptional regulator [Nocardia seriolae]
MAGAPAKRSKGYAPRMSPEARREQLLDAVLTIVVEQGVHKVSMDTVAREVGVTRPVVYSVFSDTDDMLRASLDREQAAALAQTLPLLAAMQASDAPSTAVLNFLDGFLAAVQAAPDRWRAAFSLVDSTTPKLRRRVDRQRKAAVELFEDYLRRNTTSPDTDIEMTARVIFTLTWEAGRMLLSEPEIVTRQRMLTFARAIITEHLETP